MISIIWQCITKCDTVALSENSSERTWCESQNLEKSAESIEKYIADNLDSHIDLVFGESFGAATAGMMFNRQKVKIDSIMMSGPQYQPFEGMGHGDIIGHPEIMAAEIKKIMGR